MIIEGAISVKAAIKCKKRNIETLYINKDKKTKDFNYIRKLAKTNNINIKELKKEELDELASSNTYGGILAIVDNKKEDEFDLNEDIFYLDGIEDPFNIGYCLRTLYAFGFKNVLLSKRDYTNMESQLLKSSAGAYEFLNIKVADDEYQELKKLKEDNKYYFYCLSRVDDSKDIFEVKFKKKAIYCLGGEKRGISSNIMSLCDTSLFIKYGSDFRNSLNAAAALDVLATLIYKQKK